MSFSLSACELHEVNAWFLILVDLKQKQQEEEREATKLNQMKVNRVHQNELTGAGDAPVSTTRYCTSVLVLLKVISIIGSVVNFFFFKQVNLIINLLFASSILRFPEKQIHPEVAKPSRRFQIPQLIIPQSPRLQNQSGPPRDVPPQTPPPPGMFLEVPQVVKYFESLIIIIRVLNVFPVSLDFSLSFWRI